MLSTAHPVRPRWALNGPWWLRGEPGPDRPAASGPPARSQGDWRQVPPATHLQPWMYPHNPYWGPHVRAINDSAWWYRTSFARPNEAGDARRWRLLFEAVDYRAEVWLNGQRLGEHEGGFAPFAFEVTDLLQAENEMAVRVTSPWDPIRRRGLTFVDEVHRRLVKGLYAHADGLIPPDVNPIGIWRPAWLEAHADVTIEGVPFSVAQDEYDRSAQLTLHLHVGNRRAERLYGVLHVHLSGETFEGIRADDNYPVEVSPGSHVIEQDVRIPDPHWWWPWDLGRPDLYRLRCTLYDNDGAILDVHEQVLGIRQVRLLRSRETVHFQINRVPFYVRGTAYIGGLYLSQLTPEQIEEDLERVCECGLNLIRLHVHVAPPEVYAACDRRGIMIWQDFELNWIHDFSPEFEDRAVGVLREMVAQLGGHPSIIAWSCHNEPTALPFEDRNLVQRPDPRLYDEIRDLDPSRPAFICSGRQEDDWRRSGDAHHYIGGAHGGHYLDVYGARTRLVTEFGCEAPLNESTLDETPFLAKRLAHLRGRIDDIQAYQAALLKYQIEWYRITRFDPCGGYIQFMLADLCPQVGCGVLDAARRPKAAYEALRSASQPVHVLMEYTASHPAAVWVVNDLNRPLLNCLVEWQVLDQHGEVVTRGSAQEDIPAQRAHRVALLRWSLAPDQPNAVVLRLSQRGQVLDENRYQNPFHPLPRPKGFPWQFDAVIGMRCYGGRYAQSSLRVFNTWHGRIASWIFPVYTWAEQMLAHPPDPKLRALFRILFG